MIFRTESSSKNHPEPMAISKSRAEKYSSDKGELAVSKPKAAAKRTSIPLVDSRPRKSLSGEMREVMVLL